MKYPAAILLGSAALAALSLARLQSADGSAAATPSAPAVRTPGAMTDTELTAHFQKVIVPLLETYCYDCHGDGSKRGEFAIDSYKSLDDMRRDSKRWETLLSYVHKREMPPADASGLPSPAERGQIIEFVEQALYGFDARKPDPGRVTLRRLNRAEYDNTIRDLVGVDFSPAADFPPDDSGYGFDNNGDVLSLPPMLFEKYLAAADKVMDQAIATEPVRRVSEKYPAALAEIGFNAVGDRGDGWVALISLEEDDVTVERDIPAAGDYIVRVHAFANPRGGALVGGGSSYVADADGPIQEARLGIMLGTTFIKDFSTSLDESKPGTYEVRVGVPAGRQRFRAVARRLHGGEFENTMLNGKTGLQQQAKFFVRSIEIEGPLPAAVTRYGAKELAFPPDARLNPEGDVLLDKAGEASVTFNAPQDGDYILRAYAYANQSGAEWAKMQLRVNSRPVETFDVQGRSRWTPVQGQRVFSLTLLYPLPYAYEIKTTLKAGENTFSAAFLNDHVDAETDNPNFANRDLVVRALEVVNLSEPPGLPPLPPPMRELFDRHEPRSEDFARAVDGLFGLPAGDDSENAAARGIIADFTRRAWRRPVQPGELDRLMKLYELSRAEGDSFKGGVKLALKAALVSPNFLFIGTTPVAGAQPQPVTEHELAARLSYFLWSSMPDDELLGLADRGQLRANLDAQVRRMLASPKSRALVDNFASQWLELRHLANLAPDKEMFPGFDDSLKSAMRRETEMFTENVFRNDLSVIEFLNANYTFANERLARLYGIEGVDGEEFRKVSLAGTARRGVLTQGSVLVLTSNPTRTSPVKRGKWVLDNLLGSPPPPAPPTVPALEDTTRPLNGTLRQQMEQHRADPTCASCHARMDPIGFGLENFDAVGNYRNMDGEAAVDASGTLMSGESFTTAAQLAEILATTRQDDFARCLAEKLLTYSLGRGLEYYDRPVIDGIVEHARAHGYKFSAFIEGVTRSTPFQMERGAETPAPAPETNASPPAPNRVAAN